MTASQTPHLPSIPPIFRTQLIGRAPEIAAVTSLLLREDVPLVTLTGPGGVGKTRLAVQIATTLAGEFAEGIAYVSLAPIRDQVLVLPTIAESFGIRVPGDRSLALHLATALHGRPQLLVLDNLEHVLQAAPNIAALLAACPTLTILATSRSVLRITGEHVFVLPPLPLPTGDVATIEDLTQNEAVKLFVARAQAVAPGFTLTAENTPAIAAICQRLDGLPLAIELAAARVRVLSPATLLDRLTEPLRLLTGGARDQPPRLRTMWDAVAWSFDLLSSQEQMLFRRLAVFVGGCTLAAAEAVCAEPGLDVLEGITALVEQSLLRPVEPLGAVPRFAMLETVREYAAERLAAAGENALLRAMHASYFTTLAERGIAGNYTSTTSAAARQFAAERPNVRAALDWEAEQGATTLHLRLAAAGWWYSEPAEGFRALERAVLATAHAAPERQGERALLLVAMGEIAAVWLGNVSVASPLIEQGLSLAREAEEPRAIALGLFWLGMLAAWNDQLDRALEMVKESLAQRQALADSDWWRAGDAHYALGYIAAAQGDYDEAETRYSEALASAQAVGADLFCATALEALGTCARERGDQPRAARLFAESLSLVYESRETATLVNCLKSLGAVAASSGRPEQAAKLFGAAEAQRERHGMVMPPQEIPRLERAMAPARHQLTDVAFARAWAVGRALPLDQAVAEAFTVADEVRSLPKTARAMHFGLSPRETEVLRLVAEGLSNREIANSLSLSERTVENHVLHVLNKLDTPSRTAAAGFAIRHGLA